MPSMSRASRRSTPAARERLTSKRWTLIVGEMRRLNEIDGGAPRNENEPCIEVIAAVVVRIKFLVIFVQKNEDRIDPIAHHVDFIGAPRFESDAIEFVTGTFDIERIVGGDLTVMAKRAVGSEGDIDGNRLLVGLGHSAFLDELFVLLP